MTADPLLDRIPIIIGVTGHRDLDLRPEYDTILRERVGAIFERLQRGFPTTPLLLLTPLAEGADQLVAEVARARGIPFRVPLPMPLAQYREDFTTEASLAEFDALLAAAQAPPYPVSGGGLRDAGEAGAREARSRAYALVGAHIVRSSHVLIALWNGLPSEAEGGTAQIVRFRVFGVPARYLRSQSVLEEAEIGPVHHVYAARTSERGLAKPVGTYSLRVAANSEFGHDTFDAIEERPGDAADPFELLYTRIEAFNSDCLHVPDRPAASEEESATSRLMATAERLATFYQQKSRVALTRLFVATAVAALMFQLYASLFPELHVLVALYVLALCVAIATFVFARRGRWQDRAQDYRALELGLNVQHVWDAVGLGESVADYYMGRQRTELEWIPKAIAAAHTVDRRLPFDPERGIAEVRAFVLGQYAYFAGATGKAGAASREEAKSRRFEWLRRWAFRAGLLASILLIAFAFTAPIWPELYGDQSAVDNWHNGLIFAIACAAIAAALLDDYLERRGFGEHARRYELMAGLYRRALDALDDPERPPLDSARTVIAQVGHEALAENGDWVLMHRALPIELLQV